MRVSLRQCVLVVVGGGVGEGSGKVKHDFSIRVLA